MLRQIEKLANKVAKAAGFAFTVKVKELSRRVDPKDQCYAMWDENLHTMWIRITRPDGKPYTCRHLISCVVHELSHHKCKNHDDAFHKEQRRLSRIARRITRAQ